MKTPKPLSWFVDRINKPVYLTFHTGHVIAIAVKNSDTAAMLHKYEAQGCATYRDKP